MTWTTLQNLIQSNHSFLITSHKSPDGDCVGSQMALYWYLTSLDKEVVVFNKDTLPKKFHYFPFSEIVTATPPTKQYDVLCILDASNPERVGIAGVQEWGKLCVNIDHHRDNSLCGDLNFVNPSAAATCQIMHDFFSSCAIDYPAEVAEALYGGLLTDTGGFQHNNTTEAVLAMAADLVPRGANPALAYKKLFATYSVPGLQLRSQIWGSLAFYGHGKIGVMQVDLGQISHLGADIGDIDGMANMALTAEGVEVGVFVKYDEKGVYFSLRSAGTVDVGSVAASFSGGGGHACAAGCSALDSTSEKSLPLLLALLEEALP